MLFIVAYLQPQRAWHIAEHSRAAPVATYVEKLACAFVVEHKYFAGLVVAHGEAEVARVASSDILVHVFFSDVYALEILQEGAVATFRWRGRGLGTQWGALHASEGNDGAQSHYSKRVVLTSF